MKQFCKGVFFIFTSLLLLALLLKLTLVTKLYTSGASAKQLFTLLSLYLPYFTPLALSMASFFAAIITASTLSRYSEIRAFRVAGLSLFKLYQPLCILSLIITSLSMIITAELIPWARKEIHRCVVSRDALNPLTLAKKGVLPHLANTYIDFELASDGKKATGLCAIDWDKQRDAIRVAHIDEVTLKEGTLSFKGARFIQEIPEEKGFDRLLIESESSSTMAIEHLENSIGRKSTTSLLDISNYRQLITLNSQESLGELYQRIALSFLPYTLTALGFAGALFRGTKRLSLLLALPLLASYLIAKNLSAGALFFALPFVTVWFVSYALMRYYERGAIA